MLIYENIANITDNKVDTIIGKTEQLGWNVEDFFNNPVNNSEDNNCFRIFKNKQDHYQNITLGDNLLVYQKYGNEDNGDFRRIMTWKNDIKPKLQQGTHAKQLINEIDSSAQEARDKRYLAHKLLRHLPDQQNELMNYLEQIE